MHMEIERYGLIEIYLIINKSENTKNLGQQPSNYSLLRMPQLDKFTSTNDRMLSHVSHGQSSMYAFLYV